MTKARTYFKKLIAPRYGLFIGIIILNRFRNLFLKPIQHKYLFILSPPYCGSTLLNEIISTSFSVSVNNPYRTREGQTLPSVRDIMFNKYERWDEAIDFDWVKIKNEWRKYWDLRKPILLEKSPPNILRAASINLAFENAYFIIFHRNPYAHCESLISRNKMTPVAAAEFAMFCLEKQKINLDLEVNSIAVSYENLTSKPEAFKSRLHDFLPEINDIDVETDFNAHNFKNKPMSIQNLNSEKINKLTQSQLEKINKVFSKYISLLESFNYEVMDI